MIGVNGDPSSVIAATSQTLRRLTALTGFSQRQVLLGFAGVVLKTWAGRTKVATEAQVDHRMRYRVVRRLGYTTTAQRGDVTVNAGYKDKPYGRIWVRVRNPGNNRKNYLLALGPNFTAPSGSGVFNQYRPHQSATTMNWVGTVLTAATTVPSAVERAQKSGRQSIGLARQSVVQIADALGIDLLRVQGGGTLSAAGIAKARAALASTGKFYRNGTGAQGGDEIRDYVDLINMLPYGQKIGLDRTLLGVLAGQNKYFEKSYAKGAFDSQRKACAAYPNLFRFNAAA